MSVIEFPGVFKPPPPRDDNILRHILDSLTRSRVDLPVQQLRVMDRDCRELQQRAVKQFAALNGFRIGSRRRYAFEQHKICDHSINVSGALIGQPYNYREDWKKVGEDIAAKNGFALHVPPYPLASIHFPGSCAFLVFTKPGIKIQWLPEQITGIAPC